MLMQKFKENINISGNLLERGGEHVVFTTHAYTEEEPWEDFIFIVLENKKREAALKEVEAGLFVPLIAASRAGFVGHCFKQKVTDSVTTAPVYYGTIKQPCNNLGVIVALDPCHLPTVYTGSDETTNSINYTLAVSEGSYIWDGGEPESIVSLGLALVEGTESSGNIYVFTECTPCFNENNEIELEVYCIPGAVCCYELPEG
jgi:hypothetical protein